MPQQDQMPARRTAAAWISRYAAGLLASNPSLQPLDAVRMAMDASAGSGDVPGGKISQRNLIRKRRLP